MAEPRVEIERFDSDGSTPPPFEQVRGLDLPVEPLPAGTACRVARAAGRPVARLSLHVRDDLVGAPGTSGMVGHYEALDRDAGALLLRSACAELAERGAARVIGPMNGSTWARYRFALPPGPDAPGGDPPFFTAEPRNPYDYPGHFEAAGFTVAARYESHLDDLAAEAPDVPEVAARVARAGFSLRPIDLDRFDAEIDMLFSLSLEAFAQNLYYAPIEADVFRGMYHPLRGRMDPELVLVAIDGDGRPCGYHFAYEDPVTRPPGGGRYVIAKTVAVAPRARGHGLANHMLDRVRATARRRGGHQMIHALMYMDNVSMRMSARTGARVWRRYALWEWTP